MKYDPDAAKFSVTIASERGLMTRQQIDMNRYGVKTSKQVDRK